MQHLVLEWVVDLASKEGKSTINNANIPQLLHPSAGWSSQLGGRLYI